MLQKKFLHRSNATRADWTELGNRSAVPCDAKGFSRLFDTIKQVAKRASGIGGRDLNHINKIIR